MDKAERKRFLDALRSDGDFRSAVRQELLTQELLNLPEVVASLATDLQQLAGIVNVLVDSAAQQRQDFTDLATDVRTYMERTITILGEGFTAIRGEISELRTQTDTGLTGLRADINTGFRAVDAKIDQVNTEIREIRDERAS